CKDINKRECNVDLTYTTKITNLEPAPYDTNCLEYKTVGYSSKENCISECLANFTERNNMMIESNVIQRSKYENSSLILIPGILRSLQDGQSRWLSIDHIKKYMMLEVDNSTQYAYALLDKLRNMLPSYKTHWKSCIDFCSRPDCLKESHVTIVHSVFGSGNTSSRVTGLSLWLYP